jgi:outer membrane protein
MVLLNIAEASSTLLSVKNSKLDKKEVFMKRMILLSLFCLAGIVMANAQRFALIDMEYIMENIPEYQQANNELELASQQYQKAVEAKAKEAEALYLAYKKAANTLSATQRTQKEEAIVAKEREAAELRKKYFGPEGEMAEKQEALIAPIENRVYEAVKQISTQKGYDAVIDRASATSIIFASPRIDISNEVLAKLGYSN